MSDTATETPAAPAPEAEAPVAEPAATPETVTVDVTETAPAAEAGTPEADAPTGPQSRKEARRAMHEAREARQRERAKRPEAEVEAPETDTAEELAAEPDPDATEEVAVNAAGRKYNPKTGRFLAETDGGADSGADTEQDTEQDTEASPDESPAPDGAAEPPATPEEPKHRIEVDPEHPLRQMGVDALDASSPVQERAIRALLNGTYNRRQDVETRDKQIAELQEKLVRMESTQTASQKWQQTPQYQEAVEEYQSILDAVGQDAATRYWEGRQSDFRKLADQEYSERMGKVQEETVERQAKEWAESTQARLSTTLPTQIVSMPDYGRFFTEEVELFNRRIELGHFEHLKSRADFDKAFDTLLKDRLVREPATRAVFQQVRGQKDAAKQQQGAAAQEAQRAETARRQQAEKAAAAKAAVEEFKREAAEKRLQTPPNPLGSLAHVGRTGRDGAPSDEGPDLAAMSPIERKKTLKRAAREDFRAKQRFGT